jgi:hypothetical protein
MAESQPQSKPTTFPLFSRLPPELRNRIWHDALPEDVGPTLYFYKKGCWRPRQLLISEKGYDRNVPENNLVLGLDHNLFDRIRINVPIANVGTESRSIAVAWAREQGLRIRTGRTTHELIFLRAFDPVRDALYVAPIQLYDFLYESMEWQTRMYPDDPIRSGLKNIAVANSITSWEYSALPEIFSFVWLDLGTLYVVTNPPPDLDQDACNTEARKGIQPRWEFEGLQKVVGSSWNGRVWTRDYKGLAAGYSREEFQQALLVEEACDLVEYSMDWENIHSFEVRPVLAKRK